MRNRETSISLNNNLPNGSNCLTFVAKVVDVSKTCHSVNESLHPKNTLSEY